MSQLILRDADGKEVGRRAMNASERLDFYRAWDRHELITYQNKTYLIKTVAWQIPAEDLVLSVVFDSPERLGCGCSWGSCTCD